MHVELSTRSTSEHRAFAQLKREPGAQCTSTAEAVALFYDQWRETNSSCSDFSPSELIGEDCELCGAILTSNAHAFYDSVRPAVERLVCMQRSFDVVFDDSGAAAVKVQR